MKDWGEIVTIFIVGFLKVKNIRKEILDVGFSNISQKIP